MGNKFRRQKQQPESSCYTSSSDHSNYSNDKFYETPLVASKSEISCDETHRTKFTDRDSMSSESNYADISDSGTNANCSPQQNLTDIGCRSAEFNTPSPEFVIPESGLTDVDSCHQEFVAVSVPPTHLFRPLASTCVNQCGERSTDARNQGDADGVGNSGLGSTQMNRCLSEFVCVESSTFSSGESCENFCRNECMLLKIPGLNCSLSEITTDNDATLSSESCIVNRTHALTTMDRFGRESMLINHSQPQG